MSSQNSQNPEAAKRVTKVVKKTTPHMPAHELAERWFIIDAEGAVVGRIATSIAKLLMGKDLPSFNGGVDAKTNVIVINAGKVRFSGNKFEDKQYFHHTGYLSGLKTTTPMSLI